MVPYLTYIKVATRIPSLYVVVVCSNQRVLTILYKDIIVKVKHKFI